MLHCEKCWCVEYCSPACRESHIDAHSKDCDLIRAHKGEQGWVKGNDGKRTITIPNCKDVELREFVRLELPTAAKLENVTFMSYGAIANIFDERMNACEAGARKFEGRDAIRAFANISRTHRGEIHTKTCANFRPNGSAVFMAFLKSPSGSVHPFVVVSRQSVDGSAGNGPK